jgi:CheY-like chemotaxis protein
MMSTKILLVDDEEHIKSVLSGSFSTAGNTVGCAATGEDGLG